MQGQFKEIITKFYDLVLGKNQLPDVYKHALDRYLNYAQRVGSTWKEQARGFQSIRSFRSGGSTSSNETLTKIKKLFNTTHLETAIFFSYFLLIVKSDKPEYLGFLLQKVSEKVVTVRKRVSLEQKKKFEGKFKKLYDQLKYLSSRSKINIKIEWLYFEVFTSFEPECSLLAQFLCSTGDELQKLQNIRENEFIALFMLLKIKCHIFNQKTSECKVNGFGQYKLYIGTKGDKNYFIMSENQFELELKQSSKEQIGLGKQASIDEKRVKKEKKCLSPELKEQILAHLSKLKQDYEQNTRKIATFCSFKDTSLGWEQTDQTRQA